MADEPSSYYAQVDWCEAAIGRIRAALRAGDGNSDAVRQDLTRIQVIVAPRLDYRAKEAARYGPEAADEALDLMLDQLIDDILSPSFVSLETKFGAYLKTMPMSALRQVRRKYGVDDTSSPMIRIDQPNAQGYTPGESIPDDDGQARIDGFADRDALMKAMTHLNEEQRTIVTLRHQGYRNNEIALRLGMTELQASRVYERALTRLRHLLGDAQEGL